MITNSMIAAALTALIYILLGAIATIAIALVLKSYLLASISRLDNIINPRESVRALQNVFNFFRIPNYHLIKVNFNSTFIDDDSGIVIVVPEGGFVYSGLVPQCTDQDCIDFTYHLPQMTKNNFVQNAKIGWRKLFQYKSNTYALTLISLEPYETVTFDFRRVNKTVREVD